MSRFLGESFSRANRPPLLQALYINSTAQYEADLKLMSDVADKCKLAHMLSQIHSLKPIPLVIAQRRANPVDKKDLLNTMLTGKDAQTGLGLPQENIRAQVNSIVVFFLTESLTL